MVSPAEHQAHQPQAAVHDDAYDLTGGSKHILIENGFAMTMDDAFAFYAARCRLEDVVVKGFVDYGYTSALVLGMAVSPRQACALRDVHFVSTQNKFAIWIQFTPAYFNGTGVSTRASSKQALDDFHLSTARGSMTAADLHRRRGFALDTSSSRIVRSIRQPARKITGDGRGSDRVQERKLTEPWSGGIDQLSKLVGTFPSP